MRRAIVAGLLQGPTEMAPVSSSAHIALLTGDRDAGLAKGLQIVLHGAGALALALTMGGRLREAGRRMCAEAGPAAGRSRLALLALSLGPPVLVGALFERPIERRLRGPRPIAAGLALGAAAMALADRRAHVRTIEQARPSDGLALGLAQAAALAPGISRRGATLAAARVRGFGRRDADALSWLVALPVIAGACALKGVRLAGGPQPDAGGQRRELAAGALAAFAATRASARLALRVNLATAPLAPFCLYRLALALRLARASGRIQACGPCRDRP